jgi:hypothetical protein
MIEVRSLLRQPDGSFEPYQESDVPPPDPYYVEGAIELVVDGIEVIGQAEWDLVDQLWAYIADMLKQLREKNEVRTGFPDAARDLVIRRTSPGRVLVACESSNPRQAPAVEADLVRALAEAGIAFFEKVSKLLPENVSAYDLATDDLRQAVFPR